MNVEKVFEQRRKAEAASMVRRLYGGSIKPATARANRRRKTKAPGVRRWQARQCRSGIACLRRGFFQDCILLQGSCLDGKGGFARPRPLRQHSISLRKAA